MILFAVDLGLVGGKVLSPCRARLPVLPRQGEHPRDPHLPLQEYIQVMLK